MIFNTVVKWGWSKVVGVMLAIPVIGILLFIAFFKMSELSLVPFIAKLWRTRFLDTTKKFQANTTTKVNRTEMLIKASQTMYEDKQTQEKKTLSVEDINKKPLSSDELLS